MKTRSGKNNDIENLQHVCIRKTPGKSTNSKEHINTSSMQSDIGVENRTVLKEKTNLHSFKLLCVKSKDRSPTPLKEIRGRENLIKKKVLRFPTVTEKENNLNISHSSHDADSQHSSRSNSIVKRCVYIDTLPEEREVTDKESVYEFVVDKNEPPSRRRRYRKKRANINPKGYPRKRIQSASEESLFASSSVASSAPSCHTTSVGGNLSFKEAAVNDNPAVTPLLSSNHLDDLISSPLHPIGTPPTPPTVISSRKNKDTSVAVYKNLVDEVPSNILSLTGCPNAENGLCQLEKNKTIFIANNVVSAIDVKPTGSPSKSSLCNSSLYSDGPSVCITMAKHHSTPCKSRSGSDSSSYLQLGEQVAPKEDCFGFSSDEDENMNDLPSPLHLSPYSRAHRQGLLSPCNAPSRFAPEIVRRILALKAVTKPLDFGSSKDSLTREKMKVSEKGGMKLVKRRGGKRSEMGVVLSKNLLCADTRGMTGDALQTEGPTIDTEVRPLTPLTECLFEDLEEEDKLLKTLPPRKSYERSLPPRTRRVVGGGLCLESADEDDLDENVAVENGRGGKHSPKFHKRRNKNAEKKEKEMDQWALLMKTKFEEVDDYDLCVD